MQRIVASYLLAFYGTRFADCGGCSQSDNAVTLLAHVRAANALHASIMVRRAGKVAAPSDRKWTSKVSFGTELKNAFTLAVKQSLAASDDIDLRRTFAPAIAAVEQIPLAKIRVCSGPG